MDSQVANCFVTGSNFSLFTPCFSKKIKRKIFIFLVEYNATKSRVKAKVSYLQELNVNDSLSSVKDFETEMSK